MRGLLTASGVALALIASQGQAQVGALYDADITDSTSINDPAIAAEKMQNQWLAFSLPVLDGTHSPCCWKGKWDNMGEVGCSLGNHHQSYGSRSDSPTTDKVIVFSEIKNGDARSIQIVGESCPVDADGASVTWIDRVDEKAGLDWLVSMASSDDSTLYALGLHRSADANTRLFELAKKDDDDLAEQAIFWLGEARGADGLDSLERLLEDLPPGHTRRQINFAISQNSAPGAAVLLEKISEDDRDAKQRSDALFWLAQEYPARAEGILLEVINNEKNGEVLEQAVFAISQLPSKRSSILLMDLAKDQSNPRHVRRQALFWLANSDDDKTVAALVDMLSR